MSEEDQAKIDEREIDRDPKLMEDVSNKVGAPPAYKTPEELQSKISDYFNGGYHTRIVYIRDKNGSLIPNCIPKITITGLAYYLGFASRQSFYDYELKEEFAYTIKRARMLIEREYEEQLDVNPTGAIFALKNFKWTDKQEIEHSGGIDTNKDDLKNIATQLDSIIRNGQPQADSQGDSEEPG